MPGEEAEPESASEAQAAPDSAMDELTERVQRLEARLTHFEQRLRSYPDPPTAATDTPAADMTGEASPEVGNDAIQAHEEPGHPPEG
jgi:hypothetical protein